MSPNKCKLRTPEAAAAPRTAATHSDFTFHVNNDAVPCHPLPPMIAIKDVKHFSASLPATSVSGCSDVMPGPRSVHTQPKQSLCLNISCGPSSGLAQTVLGFESSPSSHGPGFLLSANHICRASVSNGDFVGWGW